MNMTEISSRIMKNFEYQKQRAVKENLVKLDELKADREGATHSLDMHRELCVRCQNKTLEEIESFLTRCIIGQQLAKYVREKNKAVRDFI